MGQDWGKVKNCCQTTGEAWDFATDDVSETEKCAEFHSEGEETRIARTFEEIKRGPESKPGRGKSFVTRGRGANTGRGAPLSPEFATLKSSDEFCDMDKLDSVASSAPGTDFNKLATRDLILPGIVANSRESVKEMQLMVTQLRQFKSKMNLSHKKDPASPSRSNSIYFINEADLPSSVRNSRKPNSKQKSDFQSEREKIIQDSDLPMQEALVQMNEEYKERCADVVSYRAEGHQNPQNRREGSTSSDSELKDEHLPAIPSNNPVYDRRIKSAPPIKIRIDSYDSDNVADKEREYQFQLMKQRQEVEYWKKQKRKADVQMKKMSAMLVSLQARLDAISPETKGMKSRGQRNRASSDDFHYSRSHSRQRSPEATVRHFKRKKKRKRRKEQRFTEETNQESVKGSDFNRQQSYGGSDLGKRRGGSESRSTISRKQ